MSVKKSNFGNQMNDIKHIIQNIDYLLLECLSFNVTQSQCSCSRIAYLHPFVYNYNDTSLVKTAHDVS